MRILLLTHYYWPEFGAPQRRWSSLVQRFIAEGHEVLVVAPPPHYPHGQLRHQALQEHPIGRLDRGPHGEPILRTLFLPHGQGLVSRSADQAVAAADAVWRLWWTLRPRRRR